MTLVRWRPMHDVTAWHPVTDLVDEFDRMQHEIDHMFDRWRGGSADNGGTAILMPAVDIAERKNDFNIRVELPGVKKEDVKINVQNDVLTIKGEKKHEAESDEGNYHRIERSYGTFQRSFTLPTSVKSDKIEASYDNGVLTIALPKAEEAKPKEIEVKVK